MDWFKVGLITLMGILFVGLILIVAEYTFSTSKYINGTVVACSYTPSSTGVGTGVTSSGKTTTVVTTHSEVWAVVVTLNDGETVGVKTTSARWASLKKGDGVKVRKEMGAIFGLTTGLFVD